MNHSLDKKMPHLECVERFNQLPVIESAFGAVGDFYHKLKRSHSVAEWTLCKAEAGVTKVANTLEGPLHLADSALCSSLSLVEDNVPAVKLPTHQLIENVRSLMRDSADAVTRPVLRRASSVRDVAARRVHEARDFSLLHANQVISTRVGSLAADGFEKGLGIAEQLLDTYLPDDQGEIGTENDLQQQMSVDEDEVDAAKNHHSEDRVLETVHRVDHLTRTLQRRITRRTMARVKSVREHATDALKFLLQITYTAATEPRASAAYVSALWSELSHDEPENQPPPQTIEQRSALLVREGARRIVHAINAVATLPGAAASTVSQLLLEILHGLRLDEAVRAPKVQQLVARLASYINEIVENLSEQWKQMYYSHVPNNHIHTD